MIKILFISLYVFGGLNCALSQHGRYKIPLGRIHGFSKEENQKNLGISFNTISSHNYFATLKGIPSYIEKYTLSRSFTIGKLNGSEIIVPTLLGFSKDKRKVVIFDANLNHDFSDDSVLYQNNSVDSRLDDTIHEQKIVFRLAPFNTVDFYFRYTTFKPKFIHMGEEDEREFLMIQPFQYYEGEIVQHKNRFKVVDTRYLFNFDNSSLKLFVERESATNKNAIGAAANSNLGYQIGDTIAVENGSLLFTGCSTFYDTLFLESFSKKEVVGYYEGYLAPAIYGFDTYARPINLSSMKGKFVILDFWGTWCGPCIDLIPNLKSIHSRYTNDKLEIVGIALDKEPLQVNNFISENNIPWRQVFQNRFNKNDQKIISNYKTTEYPTTLLIDPSGKIVLRISGKSDFYKLEDFLLRNLK